VRRIEGRHLAEKKHEGVYKRAHKRDIEGIFMNLKDGEHDVKYDKKFTSKI
jgi:hypothetical protein